MKSKCSECNRVSVVELRYSKRCLCGSCFAGLFEKRFRRGIRTGRLLGKRDCVVVGLSGCRDSMVLLFLLSRIFFKAPHSRLLALTLDDGNESRVRIAAGLCARLGVEHHVRRLDGKLGIYGSLVNGVKALKGDSLAVGVSLQDEVLFVLDHVLKGLRFPAGVKGLKVIKPLRECLSEEIEAYARINGIKFLRKGKKVDEFKALLNDMLDGLEVKQPGIWFKMLKSTDCFRGASGLD